MVLLLPLLLIESIQIDCYVIKFRAVNFLKGIDIAFIKKIIYIYI